MTRHVLTHTEQEHRADSIVLLLGACFAIGAVPALFVWARLAAPPHAFWPLVPYGLGLLASFAFSAAYNLTLHAPTRRVLRRFDHAAIYLLIAGTYTPMALLGVGGLAGVALTTASWVIALIGVALKLTSVQRWARLGFMLYLAQGWLGGLAAWPFLTRLDGTAVALLVAGGVIYSIGTVFLHTRRIPYASAIWHVHVLTAAACHYASVLLVAR
ncbi:hemolysin III family protein [Citreicella sp. C3M06]|uniref:PAQR family membrane homeostasis protein TrhA n=1 Tax=Citreicella sp. C3M06 TaxID=2841564 RepID=UPI001C09BB84|nr:hemolysin III family protein [Citreicella sp. C3M06]MBU2962443.1 hemolysin III family protein [Citreicella sp. C3M06]